MLRDVFRGELALKESLEIVSKAFVIINKDWRDFSTSWKPLSGRNQDSNRMSLVGQPTLSFGDFEPKNAVIYEVKAFEQAIWMYKTLRKLSTSTSCSFFFNDKLSAEKCLLHKIRILRFDMTIFHWIYYTGLCTTDKTI